jgi:hypothetical protein
VVSITSSKRGSSVRCALIRPDGALPTVRPCGSSTRLTGLADGRYRFTAYAVDPAGYPDPTPAARSFTVDTVLPGLLVEVTERRLRDLPRNGVPVRVRCTEICSVRARLILSGTSARRAKLSKGRPVEIGRAFGRVRAGVASTVRVRLTAVARRRIRALKSARVTVRVSATDRAGNARGVRKDVPIVR